MISNVERRKILSMFCSMYNLVGDYNLMVNHMPTETDDPEGESFNRYFRYLQELYSLRSDVRILSGEEIDAKLNDIRGISMEFTYPTNILESFYV